LYRLGSNSRLVEARRKQFGGTVMRKGYTFATAFLVNTFLGMIGPVNSLK
jgi:hypothetical protein